MMIFLKDKLIKIFFNSVVNLPTPINLTIFWNFGSLLGLCLIIQLLSGIFLTMHYTAHTDYSFMSIVHIMQDVNYGWLVRLIHMNGASMFFISVYCHIGRGIYYGSYKFKMVWFMGVLILFMMMGTAFVGYVLPWGQMSFWGATVITNLLSAIPVYGQMLVEWLWGGFSVSNSTLNRFYTFHFLMPFILLLLVIIHLFYLHNSGSNNPLGVKSNFYMIKFHSYFTFKDLVGFMLLIYFLMYIVLECPNLLGDSENFLMANPMVTPLHIQPEWYFLFAYTILRSIPNKFGGVLSLGLSVLIIIIFLFIDLSKFQNMVYYPINQLYYWSFIMNIILLTWLGMQPVENPFIYLGQISTFYYFIYYFLSILMKLYWDILL
uniref:Cytochrome b n=2 Tax=Meteorus pulchricornis TaxID=51522 RepID=A0A857V0S9_9HYME|nr:cytochrome b [Meteorus pulchricornis]QHS69749.1 cytochrome b [Meteorus pulchricornis]WCB99553.1 cytochrome b [Meteorus pulchricornis]